jgi:hypothetical protein
LCRSEKKQKQCLTPWKKQSLTPWMTPWTSGRRPPPPRTGCSGSARRSGRASFYTNRLLRVSISVNINKGDRASNCSRVLWEFLLEMGGTRLERLAPGVRKRSLDHIWASHQTSASSPKFQRDTNGNLYNEQRLMSRMSSRPRIVSNGRFGVFRPSRVCVCSAFI